MANTLEAPRQTSSAGATLADLLNDLGVSADRVQRFPPPGTATEADFLHANERLDIRCELIDGTLVELPPGNCESMLAVQIASIFLNFVRPRKLGIVLGAGSMFRLFGGNIRMPDVAFIPINQFPEGLPEGAVWQVVPSLAVEVLSVSNTPAEMKRKRSEYFASGVQLVWIVDPKTRSVDAYSSAENFKTHFHDDLLKADSTLPGFSVRVGDFFTDLDLRSQ